MWENGKKPSFGPFSPNLGPIMFFVDFTCCKLLFYAISRKTNEPNLRKWQKTLFCAQFWSIWPKLELLIFLKKIWLRQSLDIMVSYHHVQYQIKLIIQSWENLVSDGQTDGRTDEQTDKSDFIRCCPTKIEHPTNFLEGKRPALIQGSAKLQSPQIFEVEKKN